MKTVLAALVTVAMSATVAMAGYNPGKAAARQPSASKASPSAVSGYVKGKTSTKSGNSGGFKAGSK